MKKATFGGPFSSEKENSLKRRMRGWGGRDRTSEWRNQNQLDYSTISSRIWKKA
ncbi:hypothetical protein [Bradyrhizobium sp. sGM-13]|uniref:hypothetical protein n=1 Tax=Bradyrhizobium sp. sGM-13 TaxID=2831781 RepID=UPI001BD094F4|nr:hypothetical protein [Bradyrhizobium sp. sGM-13]